MLPGRKLTIDWMLKVLVRRRWLIAGPLFLGVLGGLLYSRSQPSLYRSDAVVQVEPQRIPESYVESTVTSRVEDRLTSLAQQVLSRTQLQLVIDDLKLYTEERRTRPMEDVFALMTERVKVVPIAGERGTSREDNVDAFRISFDYTDPQIARDVVKRFAEFFVARNAKERGVQADQTSDFLQRALGEARLQLEAAEAKLKAFREKNAGRLPTQMQTNMQAIQNTQMSLQAMVGSLADDRARKLMLERLYADAAADSTAPPASSASVRPVDLASKLAVDMPPRERLAALRTLLAQLQVRLSDKHPDVVRTKSQIADLERQVATEDAERPLSPDAESQPPGTPEEARRREKLREMRAEIEGLDRQIAFKEGEERRLRDEIRTYQARLEAVPGIESEWVKITRDYDTLNANYQELVSKSEKSKMAASLEERQIGEKFKVLDEANLPARPHSPNRPRINLIGLLAGLGVGVFLAGLLEYRDATMRSEADLLGAIDLPLLALLPRVTTAADRSRQRRRQVASSCAVIALCVATAALFWYLQLWKFIV